MYIDKFLEDKYNSTFQKIFSDLEYQKDNDPEFTIEDLNNLLQTQYINQGNDWIGRGEIKDVINSATIAACEVVLSQWKDEVKSERE